MLAVNGPHCTIYQQDETSVLHVLISSSNFPGLTGKLVFYKHHFSHTHFFFIVMSQDNVP